MFEDEHMPESKTLYEAPGDARNMVETALTVQQKNMIECLVDC